MNEWQKILKPFGALWESDNLMGFEEPTTNAAIDLTLVPMLDHKLLKLEGPDTEAFLQGQLSCDLRRLSQSEHLLGAHCNAKGRMISSMRVFRDEEHRVYLRLHADLFDTAYTALKKYAVFSKVTLEESDAKGLALMGASADLGAFEPAAGLDPGKRATHATGVYLRHRSWLEFWGTEGQCQALIAAYPCRLALADTLNDLWVGEGFAEIRAVTSEAFLPQMFNYDLLDGVSFKKGCYTGQEIIARLHYRGQSKKRTYLVACSEAVIGDEIVTVEHPEQVVGNVVAASRTRALICLPVELAAAVSADTMPLQIKNKTTAILKWEPQPYAIP